MCVSESYVSQWKGIYDRDGAPGLFLGYKGRCGYLTEREEKDRLAWIGQQERLSVSELQTEIEQRYGMVYRSREPDYAWLKRGGQSYHKSETVNPKRDKELVLAKREAIKKSWLSEQWRLSKASWWC